MVRRGHVATECFRLDRNVASGSDRIRIGDRGMHDIGDLVVGRRDADRERDADRAGCGSGDRGGGRIGLDPGIVQCPQADICSVNARLADNVSVTVDEGLHDRAAAVFNTDTGAAQPDARGSAGGNGHRACEGEGVDRAPGLGVEREVSCGLDR